MGNGSLESENRELMRNKEKLEILSCDFVYVPMVEDTNNIPDTLVNQEVYGGEELKTIAITIERHSKISDTRLKSNRFILNH